MEITINVKQVIALVWTLVAVAISLIIVFAPFSPFSAGLAQWQISVLLFFVSLLVLTLPVYLILTLWQALGEKSD